MNSSIMMKFIALLISFSLSIFSAHGFNRSSPTGSSLHGSNLKHYIVYMGSHSYPNSETVMTYNHELLSSVVGSHCRAKKAIVHHYTKSFRGFSALLTPQQVENLRKINSTISVFESKIYTLHTTRSWYFMDSESRGKTINEFYRRSENETHDVIVGHIDAGVWPESKSFSDEGLRPVPKRWKGECVTGQHFTKANCNRKIIGARYYYQGYKHDFGNSSLGSGISSSRDDFGHGTHTASIAVGSEIRVDISGLSNHTLRGGAPQARIAVYKTCWHHQCSCSDILKAFDDAIDDGVDIITMSVGPSSPQNIFEDCFAIGSLHAFRRGILVSASAGNLGQPGSVVNIAPWVLTVAASTIDREVYAFVRLGNNEEIKGYGLNMNHLNGSHELVLASDAALFGVDPVEASFCRSNTIHDLLVSGKIVVCAMAKNTDDVLEKSNVLKESGAIGMILINQFDSLDLLISFAVPTSVISHGEGRRLFTYMNSTSHPTASLLHNREVLGTKRAPNIAIFSSRGPNSIMPDIIKPDITAPGVNVLAAWPPSENQRADALSFRMDSGTSMACSHASGVAAVVKAHNKRWSPAEIKSALMTTVRTKDNTGHFIQSGSNEATPLDFGSGHLYPDHAVNPGLVYDFDIEDIADFLCSYGATEAQLQLLIGKPLVCRLPPVAPYNLNYPSIGVRMMNRPMSVYRTVTFKGGKEDRKIYKIHIESPRGVKVRVDPDVLDFSNSKKATYRVDFTPTEALGYVHGSITWTDGEKHVRSPILLNLVY